MEKNLNRTETLPVRVPVLALRGRVLFPHMLVDLDVGGEKALRRSSGRSSRSWCCPGALLFCSRLCCCILM